MRSHEKLMRSERLTWLAWRESEIVPAASRRELSLIVTTGLRDKIKERTWHFMADDDVPILTWHALKGDWRDRLCREGREMDPWFVLDRVMEAAYPLKKDQP